MDLQVSSKLKEKRVKRDRLGKKGDFRATKLNKLYFRNLKVQYFSILPLHYHYITTTLPLHSYFLDLTD